MCLVGNPGGRVWCGNKPEGRNGTDGEGVSAVHLLMPLTSFPSVLLSSDKNVFEQVELLESETGENQDRNRKRDLGKANQRLGTRNRGN